MVRALSEDLRNRAVRRVEAGHSVREVAETFGVSAASVVRWSSSSGRRARWRPSRWAPAIRARWPSNAIGCCAGWRPNPI